MRLEDSHRLSVSKNSKGCGISLLQFSVASLKSTDWKNLRKISTLDSRGMNMLPPECKSATYPQNLPFDNKSGSSTFLQTSVNFYQTIRLHNHTLLRSLLSYKELTCPFASNGDVSVSQTESCICARIRLTAVQPCDSLSLGTDRCWWSATFCGSDAL
jgi:hypothetical protein